MSNVVAQIYAAIEGEVVTALGASYSKLRFGIDPEKNELRNVNEGYRLIHGPSSFSDTTLRTYTIDQEYRVILTRRVVSRLSDDNAQSDFDELYDKADDIFKQLVLTKAGLPSKILLIDGPDMSEPEILDEQIALLELSFIVKYREPLTV